MTKLSKTRQTLLFTTMALTLTIGLATPTAFAAEGDLLRTISCAGTGVGLAFDGTTLYWPKGLTSSTLGTCDVDGNTGADIPIIGLSDPISTVAYDASRDLLWAATADLGGQVRDIYQIDKTTGQATFKFSVTATGASLTDGLAYDGQDDTLWITGDISTVISHYETDGTPIAIDTPVPDGGLGFISGVAAGVDVLYIGHNGLTVITKHAKSDLSLLDTFNTGQGRTEDLECDPDTFPGVDAIWSKDAFDPSLEAFEVADGTCPIGGGGLPVGGELLPIDNTALLAAGMSANLSLIVPIAAGIAGAGAYYIRSKMN